METQTDKTQESQNLITPKVSNETSSGGTAQLVDNRASTIDQRKLQGAMNASEENSPNPIQRKETLERSRRANKTGLPDNLKSGIENLSGYSMDDVKVHYNSSKPAQLQAHAYAQGTDIHLASGQEKHLPHEAWHVVQQKQGRVRPTRQLKSKVNINDNAGLEKEADVMGEKALRKSNKQHFDRSREVERGELMKKGGGEHIIQRAKWGPGVDAILVHGLVKETIGPMDERVVNWHTTAPNVTLRSLGGGMMKNAILVNGVDVLLVQIKNDKGTSTLEDFEALADEEIRTLRQISRNGAPTVDVRSARKPQDPNIFKLKVMELEEDMIEAGYSLEMMLGYVGNIPPNAVGFVEESVPGAEYGKKDEEKMAFKDELRSLTVNGKWKARKDLRAILSSWNKKEWLDFAIKFGKNGGIKVIDPAPAVMKAGGMENDRNVEAELNELLEIVGNPSIFDWVSERVGWFKNWIAKNRPRFGRSR